jgi:uncharacterized protein YcnI
MKKIAAGALLLGAGGLYGPASAHVALEYQVAPAGASYKATFKVGHGCGARPMPKPGWALEVQREKLAQPYTGHGRTITEDVVRVTWTAKTPEDMLPHAHYDEFVLVATTPEQAGTMYWPVRQTCAEGRNDWVETPKPGQKISDLKSPAAALEILPGAGAGAHNH